MNLREKAQKYLEQSKPKKPLEDENPISSDWLSLKSLLDEHTLSVLEKHSSNIQTLQIKESELYRIFKGFEFMENVLDSHIKVLLERQRTKDEGDWTTVGGGQVKKGNGLEGKRQLQKSVDLRKKEREQRGRTEKSENKKSIGFGIKRSRAKVHVRYVLSIFKS